MKLGLVVQVLVLLQLQGDDITVKLKGGDLVINYTDETVYMTGEAERVFEGTVEV